MASGPGRWPARNPGPGPRAIRHRRDGRVLGGKPAAPGPRPRRRGPGLQAAGRRVRPYSRPAWRPGREVAQPCRQHDPAAAAAGRREGACAIRRPFGRARPCLAGPFDARGRRTNRHGARPERPPDRDPHPEQPASAAAGETGPPQGSRNRGTGAGPCGAARPGREDRVGRIRRIRLSPCARRRSLPRQPQQQTPHQQRIQRPGLLARQLDPQRLIDRLHQLRRGPQP